jgi:hypothetical protein
MVPTGFGHDDSWDPFELPCLGQDLCNWTRSCTLSIRANNEDIGSD